MGDGFRDEWLFSHLYLARALRAKERFDDAIAVCDEALKTAPDWAEFIMEKAQSEHHRGHYAACIDIASKALNMPIPPTMLWREPNQYRDQPARLISWSHKHLGNIGQAVVWAKVANEKVPGGDPVLVDLIREWEGQVKTPVKWT